MTGLSSVVRRLIACFKNETGEKGPEVNIRGGTGRTPLYAAVEHGNLDIVMMLVEADADFNVEDNIDITRLYLAKQNGNKDVQEFLMEHGAQQPPPQSRLRCVTVVLPDKVKEIKVAE
ncbi:ankyrin repeat-containing domain protein [Hypomontagnella submonticulosa]|nr:ankyrin repeat-containing domain protein [Hypomontagnella submonticulosa]